MNDNKKINIDNYISKVDPEVINDALDNKNKKVGYSVSSKIEDNSELFLGEFINDKSFDKNNIKHTNSINTEVSRKPSNTFKGFNNPLVNPIYSDEVKVKHTVCKIFTLSDQKDLNEFSNILNSKNCKNSNLNIKVMEKQYNADLHTWQVFIIYDEYQDSDKIE